MNYKDLHYRKLEMKLEKAIELIPDGTEYIVVWNGEYLTYFGFKIEVEIGDDVNYNNDAVIKTHIDWWEKHPDTFPEWDTKELE